MHPAPSSNVPTFCSADVSDLAVCHRETRRALKKCTYEPFRGPEVMRLFCGRHDDGRLAVIIGIGPLGRDLIRDVLRIVPDPPKEGRCTP